MEEKKKKKKKILILLLILLLIVGCSYSVYRIFFDNKKENVSVLSGDFLPDGKDAKKMSDKELAKYAQSAANSSQFNMMISPTATFDEHTQKGILKIRNPETNAYPINVVVTDDKTGDIIYTSGAINPGEEVSDVQLEKKMTAGTYQTTALFSLYDAKTKEKKGEVSAAVEVIVN